MKKIVLIILLIFKHSFGMEAPPSTPTPVDVQLLQAVVLSDEFATDLLLSSGANPHVKISYQGRLTTAFSESVTQFNIIKLILEKGGNPGLVESLLCDALERKVTFSKGQETEENKYEKNRNKVIELLLNDPRTYLNCKNSKGDTPLIHFVRINNRYYVEKLLKSGNVTVNDTSEEGLTALDLVKNDEMKKLLLPAGAQSASPDVGQKRKQPMGATFSVNLQPAKPHLTAIGQLRDAISQNNVAAVNTILGTHILDINDQQYRGQTPLMLASIKGPEMVAELLKNKDVNINLTDIHGASAIDYTWKNSDNAIRLATEKLLREHGGLSGKELRSGIHAKQGGAEQKRTKSKQPPAKKEKTTLFSIQIYKKLGLTSKATPKEILGVNKDATAEEIRAAYRQKVLLWHPDKSPDPLANEVFKLINWAYDKIKPN